MTDREPPPFDELPELMLSLRSFGSRRGVPSESAALEEDQERFFAPLLAGRRAAAQSVTRAQVVSAFDARRITATIDATVHDFAAARFAKRASALRAFEAELFEIIDPLRESLQALRALAEDLSSIVESLEQYERWNLWLTQLRLVFRVADSSWSSLRHALDASPRAPQSGARWRRGGTGGSQR
jgi:hypothetical protein